MPYYVYLDGDKIGDKIENYLLGGQMNAACIFSESINQFMVYIKGVLQSNNDVAVRICGGDDLLLEFFCDNIDIIRFETGHIQEKFYEMTGSTMSGGGGIRIEEVLENLSFAKKKSGKTLILGGLN